MNCRLTASGEMREVSGLRREGQANLQFALGRDRTSAVIALAAMIGVVLTGAGGCAPATVSGFDRYIPSVERAEAALVQVLDAWKCAEPNTEVAFESAPIKLQIVDTTRRPGQRLVGYEVLGEVSGEGPRTFVVRLQLDNPRKQEEARYYLVGIDPLWVFRQEDYDALAHWDACVRAED